MSHQFKPGDLALIVGAFSVPQNIGKACELVQFVQAGQTYTAPDGQVYQHCDRACWVTSAADLSANIEGAPIMVGWGLSVPEHLMPLKGDEQPAQVRQAERAQ